MKQFMLGIVVGAMMMGVVAEAGNLYKKDGSVNAPTGSQAQFDYFRQRQQQLDISHMRRQADQDRLNRMTNPCGK